ncbi:cobalamin-dependent protein [Nocardioides marinquilinus]|uniref:Cobalamin-dependent protein n=1 Tax=Nocardioides marinquilinus TaxID=1210400 RepID=A0ABP9PAN9_9ACTN
MTTAEALPTGRVAEALDDYWDAVSANDAERALQVVGAALDDGARLSAVLDDVVAACQRRVGGLWLDGEWSVAREHAATAVSEYVVRALLARVGGEAGHEPAEPGERPSPALLVACAEREWHALPALVVCTLLTEAGHRVRFLGGDVSTRTLQGALLDVPTQAVLISASLASSLLFVRRHVETASHSGIPTVVGGHGFDPAGRRARALGATAQASGGADVAGVVAGLPARVRPVEPLTGPGPSEAALLAPRTTAVARGAMSRLAERPDAPEGHLADVLADQLPVVVGCVVSGLLVDEPDVVRETGGWLGRVLDSRGGGPELVDLALAAVRDELHDFPTAVTLLDAATA